MNDKCTLSPMFLLPVPPQHSADLRLPAQEDVQRIPARRHGCHGDHGVHVHRDGVVRLPDVRLRSKPGHPVVLQTDSRRPHSSDLCGLQDVHNVSNPAVCGQVSQRGCVGFIYTQRIQSCCLWAGESERMCRFYLHTTYPILLFVGR